MIIDVHGHYMPLIKETGYEMLFDIETDDDGCKYMKINGRKIGKLDEGLVSIQKQLADMDEVQIDCRMLCVPPFAFNYKKDDKAIKWAKYLNDQMYRDISDCPSKFIGLATLPMGSIDVACEELERTMKDYGFAGAEIATNIDGVELDDKSLDPFWAKAEELGAFILLHPHYTIDEKNRLSNKFHLRNIIGNPLDTTIAAMRIIIGGIFERYPKLRICLSHSGGYLPHAISRFDHARKVRPEFEYLKSAPSDYLKSFYYDTIIHDVEALEYVMSRTSIDSILLGTDYPFDMGDLNPVDIVEKLNIDRIEKEKILSNNAALLLEMKTEVR